MIVLDLTDRIARARSVASLASTVDPYVIALARLADLGDRLLAATDQQRAGRISDVTLFRAEYDLRRALRGAVTGGTEDLLALARRTPARSAPLWYRMLTWWRS